MPAPIVSEQQVPAWVSRLTLPAIGGLAAQEDLRSTVATLASEVACLQEQLREQQTLMANGAAEAPRWVPSVHV